MQLIGTWNCNAEVPGWPPARCFGDLALLLGESIATIEGESCAVFYEGTLFDRTEQELLESPTALEHAYGVYSYVRIDRARDRIDIGTDRMGFAPLFYMQRDGGLVFGTCLSLLKHFVPDPAPNYEALDEILNLRDILGEKTVVRQIQRLRAGDAIRIQDGRVDFRTVWRPETPAFVPVETYIERNNELLAEAMEITRGASRNNVMLLSGGDDSRRLAITARAIDLPVQCVTQEIRSKGGVDKEVLIAAAVAAKLELPLATVRLATPGQAFNDALLRDYWMGYESLRHAWILPLIRHLQPGSLVYDGIVGDVAINGLPSRLHPEAVPCFGDVDRLARVLCPEPPTFAMAAGRLESSLFERIREQLRRLPDSPHRLTYFFLLNHTRRTIASWAELFHLRGHRLCCPYMYPPLFEQSLTMEPRRQMDGLLQHACAERVNPEVARIPSTRESVPAEFITDLAAQRKAHSAGPSRRRRVRREVVKLFPNLRWRLRLQRWMAPLGIYSVFPEERVWWSDRAARLSGFMDWIEDTEPPAFPPAAEQPPFLRERFLT